LPEAAAAAAEAVVVAEAAADVDGGVEAAEAGAAAAAGAAAVCRGAPVVGAKSHHVESGAIEPGTDQALPVSVRLQVP
jgi:pentose-5-phosphate-3-epimerase